jgi:hypothetical protein
MRCILLAIKKHCKISSNHLNFKYCESIMSNRRVFSAIVFCIYFFHLSIMPATASSAIKNKKFDAAPWLDDYSILKANLETGYANLLWFASPESGADLPALNKSTLSLLRQAKSDVDAESALRTFILRFGDGHLKVLEAAPGRAETIVEPARRELAGMSVEEACGVVAEGVSSDPAFSLPFESIQGFSHLGSNGNHAFRHGIYVTPNNKKIAILRIQSFRGMAYPAVCRSVWEELKQAKMDITAKAIKDEMPQAWLAALADTIAILKAQAADVLLIDLGGNGGGDDSGDWTTRLFSSNPVVSSPLFVGAANAGAYIDEQLANLQRSREIAPAERADLRSLVDQIVRSYEQARVALNKTRRDLTWVWREQRRWIPSRCGALVQTGFSSGAVSTLSGLDETLTDYITYFYWPAVAAPFQGAWDGKVFLLTDNRVGSSAEMFAAILQDNGIARVAGMQSKGAGCGNMRRIKPVTLPHSKVRFQMPDCMRLRRDGSNEVAGIKPDIPIDPIPGESARARTLRLLQGIAAEMTAEP